MSDKPVISIPEGEPPAELETDDLVVGDGDSADLFIRALAADRQPGYRVTGILALRERQAGRRIQGHPILGTPADLPEVLERIVSEHLVQGRIVEEFRLRSD